MRRPRSPVVGGRSVGGAVADLVQTGVRADRDGSGAAHLDPVIAGGVVARGEHGPGQVQAAAGEVDLVGGRETDLDHVDALAGRALGERRREAGRRRPHVVPDDDRALSPRHR